MAFSANLRKGTDIPTWDWLAFFPTGNTFHGTSHAYDGSRYIYWVIQYGSTGAVSSTTLNRYDTWSDSWQYMATVTNSYAGVDLEYDPIRNVLILTNGNGATSWQIFNLNQTAVNMLGQTFNPWTITTVTTVLPSGANFGASIYHVEEVSWIDGISGTATGGSTTTVTDPGFFAGNLASGTNVQIGMQIRMTSGAASGQRRTISAISSDGLTATVSVAFGSAVAAGDTFSLEFPTGTATATFNTTTLADSTQAWTTNIYANHDVLITGGTGAGQRRRIASNTGTVLTLATSVTGNTRTGAWTTTPDATSTYEILVSSDFLYYMSGSNGTGFYKIDLNTGSISTTWTTLTVVPGSVQGGGHLTYQKARSPLGLTALRGNGQNSLYEYSIGLNTWTTRTSTYIGAEVFNSGATMVSVATDYNKLIILRDSTTRLYSYDLTTGIMEPAGTLPYAAPAGYEGHRMCYAKSADGVPWLYVQRAGGQELYRLALEWL